MADTGVNPLFSFTGLLADLDLTRYDQFLTLMLTHDGVAAAALLAG
jgi:hypothetical protein